MVCNFAPAPGLPKSQPYRMFKIRDARVSQSARHLTLDDFNLGHHLRAVRLSPMSGSALNVEPVKESFSPSVPPCSCTCALVLQ